MCWLNLFVDWAGDKLQLVKPSLAELRVVEFRQDRKQ